MKKETLMFNKRCAEYVKEMKYILPWTGTGSDLEIYPNLEFLYKVDTSCFEIPMNLELNSKISEVPFCDSSLKYYIDLRDLKFHSDWNWIIELLYLIKKRNGIDIDFTSDKNEMINRIDEILKGLEA